MVKIISDSTCDLSEELCRKYDIGILPLYVRLGDREYTDGKDISPEELYAWSDEHRETPGTAAASIGDAMEMFEEELISHDGIVAFSISGKMSASYDNMRLAAEELGEETRIEVIDSENLSTGIGLLVLKAAELSWLGLTAAEIAERIRAMRKNVRASFVVDTLEYLHRGGRCSGLTALLGSVLMLHPQIMVEHGIMHPGKKYRGKLKTAIKEYVQDLEVQLKKAVPERVFITHSGCDDEIITEVKNDLEAMGIFQEILVTRAGSVISSHCGPGTLGVLFIMSV